MRALRALALAIPVALAVLVPLSLAEQGSAACVSRLRAQVCLPAPVTIESGVLFSRRYQIERDGRVRRIRVVRPRYPYGATCCIAPGVWFNMRHYYMVVGRGTRTLWHSRGELPRMPGSFDFQIVVGSHTVAFLYANYLYLAPFGGRQRRIARSELPLGFTNGGLYTWLRGRKLLLRSDSGAILKTIASVRSADYFVLNGALYFVAHGAVMRADGTRVRRLVSLRRLGLSARSLTFQPAGPLLDLEDDNRLVLVRPNGSVFAWTALREQNRFGAAGSVVVAPDASAAAFTVVTAQTHGARTVLTHGTETVYLLRANTRTPIALHRATVGLGGCGVGGGILEWQGSWLLYNNGPEDLAAIETTGRHQTIGLGRLIDGLPGILRGFGADWSGQVPELS